MKSLVKVVDVQLTQLILRLPESWHGFFLVVTSLGDPIFTVVIGVVVSAMGYLQHNVRLLFAGATIWSVLVIGGILKMLFGRARPMSDYAANLRVDTFSFPSGHSSGSMIAYGLLAYIALKLLPQPYGLFAAVICGCIIALIGISRIYLGAHFPSDVIAGWLLGGLGLLVIIFFIRPL